MLVLSRKQNEEIIIDGHIRITIVEINGSRVKLGVTAPMEVPVHRAELSRRIATTGETSERQPCGVNG